ncbi:MAG: hypothetical protein GEV28_39800 [Actinophytocola sp.]|uniref:hypothetical protein n=1 Tax=Actinophytocola sp. TaxID=1872138 RepID=UPI00132B50FF|nr:hypothetical protein [Actinophytocola sp.]MPZ86192.1 hypothetical protein [Actinophytocola sp.]
MLRHRPHRVARGVLLHPAFGWLALAALYLAGAVLNLLLAISTARMWPLVLAVSLMVVSGLCVTAAARSLRR